MRLLSWITAINVLVASGFALAGLLAPQMILPPGAAITPSTQVFAMYAAARTIPLALAVLFVIWKRLSGPVITLAILAGTIQLIDGLVGIYQHDAGKSIGPFVIALLQFYALYRVRKFTLSTERAVAARSK
jgi:hypothetical protein